MADSGDDGRHHGRRREGVGKSGQKGTREERASFCKSDESPGEDVAGESGGEAAIAPGDGEGGNVILKRVGGPVHNALVHVIVGGAVKEAALGGSGSNEMSEVRRVTGERPEHYLKAMVGGGAEVVGASEGAREWQGIGGGGRVFGTTLGEDDDAVDAIVDEEVKAGRGVSARSNGREGGGGRKERGGRGRGEGRSSRQEGVSRRGGVTAFELASACEGAKMEEAHQAQRVRRGEGGKDGVEVRIHRVVGKAQVGGKCGRQASGEAVDDGGERRDLDLIDQGLG